MTCRHWLFFPFVALLLVSAPARPADPDSLKEDLAALKAANLDTDTKSLVKFIKRRTVSEELRVKIAGLIKEMGNDEFQEREKASRAILDIGAPARPQLRAALTDRELEIRRRAGRALDKIGPPSAEAQILPAAARVLASRKPAEVCELILNYLPSIEEPDTAEDVAKALAAVALDKDGKPEAVLLKALSDKYAIKRWAAAAALTQAALKTQKAAVVKLLQDENAGVRRRVATALVNMKDKAGIPVLIKLLESKSSDDAGYAEDLLSTIAGEKSPNQPDEPDAPNAREKYRKAWEAWYKDAEAKLDLSKVDLSGVGRGYTLVGYYLYNKGRNQGKVVEIDNNNKVKWEFENVSYPVYACKVRRDRVVVCEYNANKVTERDTKGKVLWTKQLSSQPVYAERMSNGSTFIVSRNQLIEVDRNGKDVKTITRPYDVLTASRHKDGSFTVVTSNGTCVKLDKNGKQTSSFSIGYVYYLVGFKAHFLANGGLVIPDYQQNKIREYDKAGKLVTQITANRPMSVSKLPNGNYVYTTYGGSQIIELSKDGKQISAKSVPGNNVGRSRLLFVEKK